MLWIGYCTDEIDEIIEDCKVVAELDNEDTYTITLEGEQIGVYYGRCVLLNEVYSLYYIAKEITKTLPQGDFVEPEDIKYLTCDSWDLI